MDENKLKSIVEDAIKPVLDQLNDPDTGLAAINRRLDDPDTGLKRINERLDANTAAVVGLESTIKGYADSYKVNDSNIRRMEKRLETVEEKESISITDELRLAPQADI